MRRCRRCDAEIPIEARFCMQCGAPVEAACGGCGAELPSSARFCPQCGQPAGTAEVGARAEDPREPRSYTPTHLADRILTSRSALEGERKHVTVMFVDTVASTRAAESADPEVVHGIMDRFFRVVLDQVHRYEGTVNQFLGDGVMALFGAPVALEDAPRRAVLAALGIQRAVRELSDELVQRSGREIRVRIGIHSGLVVVGSVGDDLRMDYTAVGDTTNLADRLQRLAEPGEVLISGATERLVRGFFELGDLGPREVRGRSQPVRAFRVLAERAVAGRFDAVVESGLTPLVGRRRELDQLQAAYERVREGHGQVAFVVGDAGIGKSRLAHEFHSRLGAEPHVWIRGRCTGLGQQTPFHVVIDALRGRLGVEDRDTDDEALEKLRRGTAGLGGDLEWTMPYLQHLLSLPVQVEAVRSMEASERRSEMVRACRALLLALAGRQPVVILVEDLHWIDAASEEFLGFLIDSIPASRVLLILTHRPGYAHPFGDRSYHVRIALQPLGSREMGEMVGAMLHAPELPRSLRELIGEKAEGNPFFVEEIAKSLIEEGVLRVEGRRVMLERDLADVSVPDSIQDVLMARIDRLADQPKRAIQVASVIGREFALRLLERISDAGERMSSVVEELRTLELIYEKASHPELAFMFKHALTHDVAYESVLVERRKALHRIVGSAIEELYPDRLPEHYEVLASHFTAAKDWPRAFEYHLRAARKAADAFANQTAAQHCRDALALAERLEPAPPPGQLAELEGMLGVAHFSVSEFRAAADAFVSAAELSFDDESRARNLGRAAYSYTWGHDYVTASETVRRARDLAHAVHAEAADSIALVAEFELAMVTEGVTGKEVLATQAVQLAESSGDDEALAYAHVHEAQRLEWTGDYHRSLWHGERALEAALRVRNPVMAIFSRWFMGLARTALGQYGSAVAVLRDALELSQRLGDRALRARFLNTLGWCHAEFGAHALAAEYNRESAELAREMIVLDLVPSAAELYANGMTNLAGNLIALGDPDGAAEAIAPIQAALERDGDPWMRWRYSLHVRDANARLALVKGDPERALALTTEELDGARRHKALKLEARALELRGRALVTLDRRDEAIRSLEAAREVASGIEYPPVTWRSLSLLAELARRAGDRSEADRLSSEARNLVRRLTATLVETELRRELGSLGERLADDPLRAYL